MTAGAAATKGAGEPNGGHAIGGNGHLGAEWTGQCAGSGGDAPSAPTTMPPYQPGGAGIGCAGVPGCAQLEVRSSGPMPPPPTYAQLGGATALPAISAWD